MLDVKKCHFVNSVNLYLYFLHLFMHLADTFTTLYLRCIVNIFIFYTISLNHASFEIRTHDLGVPSVALHVNKCDEYRKKC